MIGKVKYLPFPDVKPAPTLEPASFFEADTPTPPDPGVDRRSFVAVHNVHASMGNVAPGEAISLSRDEFERLKASGSIQGEWPESE